MKERVVNTHTLDGVVISSSNVKFCTAGSFRPNLALYDTKISSLLLRLTLPKQTISDQYPRPLPTILLEINKGCPCKTVMINTGMAIERDFRHEK
jgi:hypothetical protein